MFQLSSHHLAAAGVYAVLAAWVSFGLVFALRTRPPKGAKVKRQPLSWVAIAFQGYAVGMVWMFERRFGEPLFAAGDWVYIATDVVVIVLFAFSLLLVWASVRRLGKQWSLEARLTENHQLITDGPYALVRHPIYTGLLGMLLATGLALSAPLVIVVAIAIYLAATYWRTHMEERLLREAFPEEYAAYAVRVPALIPRPRRRGTG